MVVGGGVGVRTDDVVEAENGEGRRGDGVRSCDHARGRSGSADKIKKTYTNMEIDCMCTCDCMQRCTWWSVPVGSVEKPVRGCRGVAMPTPGDNEISLSNSEDMTGL